MTFLCYVTSQCNQELPKAYFFKYKNAVFNGEQEKESIICVRMGLKNLSLAITPCLVMPNGDPREILRTIFLSHPRIIIQVTGKM